MNIELALQQVKNKLIVKNNSKNTQDSYLSELKSFFCFCNLEDVRETTDEEIMITCYILLRLFIPVIN